MHRLACEQWYSNTKTGSSKHTKTIRNHQGPGERLDECPCALSRSCKVVILGHVQSIYPRSLRVVTGVAALVAFFTGRSISGRLPRVFFCARLVRMSHLQQSAFSRTPPACTWACAHIHNAEFGRQHLLACLAGHHDAHRPCHGAGRLSVCSQNQKASTGRSQGGRLAYSGGFGWSLNLLGTPQVTPQVFFRSLTVLSTLEGCQLGHGEHPNLPDKS